MFRHSQHQKSHSTTSRSKIYFLHLYGVGCAQTALLDHTYFLYYSVTVNGDRYRNKMRELDLHGHHAIPATCSNTLHRVGNQSIVSREISKPCHITDWQSKLPTAVMWSWAMQLLAVYATELRLNNCIMTSSLPILVSLYLLELAPNRAKTHET